MSSHFYCELCDKSVKIGSKKRHLKSQYHKSLNKSIICKYTVKNPNFFHLEDILQSYVDDYNKKFILYVIICKWKLHFSDTIIEVKSDRLYNNNRYNWNMRQNLLSKIVYLDNDESKFFHISEMNIVFISDPKNMTYENYINLPKSMLEWTLVKKLANNPKLIKAFNINSYHPLIQKYGHIINFI